MKPTEMLRTACARCAWVFDVIALPAPIDVCAPPMQHAYCPLCGNLKGNTIAPARELTAEESEHYVKVARKARDIGLMQAGLPPHREGATNDT
jgi:hypothetical protein